jgi:pseudouridine kinase
VSEHVAVVGTVFVDCKGFSAGHYVPLGRNVGSVRFVHGGVGRNVAENIAQLGLAVSLVSSVDNGPIGLDVCGRLALLGVDNSFLSRMDTCGMGMWLAVMDSHGELAGSISQMPDLQGMAAMIESRGEELMTRATHVALELDLNEKITRQLLKLAGEKQRPVYGLPGNLEVIMAAPDVLTGLACFICNQIELGRLCGEEFAETDSIKVLERLPRFVRERRMQSMVVTLGAQGCAWYDASSDSRGHHPALKVNVVDTCGAGDAFFSGTVAALVQGAPLSSAVVQGTRVAACTIQSTANSCPGLYEALAGIE